MTRGRRSRGWLVALALMAATVAGCARSVDATTTPPPLRLGEDVCTRSGMIISNPAYAAAYWTRGGEVRPFDDIGSMILHHREHHEDVAAFWVHDLQTREWVRADRAAFLVSPYLRTPMGFGVAALASEEEARAQAARLGGRVLTFEQLLDYPYLREGGHGGH